MTSNPTFRVVIAGGGVAAVETALALRELAGDRVSVALVAPNAEFSYRPWTVREPFAYAPANRYRLADIAADIGAELIADELSSVDLAMQTVRTAEGMKLPYDALVLAVGATMRPAFTHAVTVDDRRMDELLHGIVEDVEGGYVRSIAFVAPAPMAWPLPLYELALMSARRAYDMSVKVAISIITPERTPLEVFGERASAVVGELLSENGITTATCADVRMPAPGQLVLQPEDRRIEVDSVVALPVLVGPHIRGLPAGDDGFIPTGMYGQVPGPGRVYAAGDATDYPIKQGGIAAQQAVVVAAAIAALAGAGVTPSPFRPEIQGMLLTGGAPRYMRARIVDGAGVDSEISDSPISAVAAKVTSTYLAPYLAGRAGASTASLAELR
jgi:sulfide:quinone oxidoreductase